MTDLLQQKSSFFSSQNEAMLDRLLYSDFQRRVGELNEKQKDRLVKTVRHYMTEVYENLGERPVASLNKEVLGAVVPDFLSYIRRSSVTGAPPTIADVSTRFGELQNERQDSRPPPPAAPDFRIPLDENSESALTVYENTKKMREAEALRDAQLAASAMAAASGTANPYVESSDRYRLEADEAKKRDETAMVQRTLARQKDRNVMMSMPPDNRVTFAPQQQLVPSGSGLLTTSGGFAQSNPTLALPDTIRPRPSLPQDAIKKQDDIVSYRENEYNLFIYSADRDWVSNSSENRYNFSVNFDPANNRSGFGYSTAANIKFKNIVRIELVKVIVPTEGVDTLVKKTSATAYDTSININALSFPYLMLRIPELDTNNFGTNNNLDNSFGVVQYDANWISDNTANNRGYLAMIPKFMKCQKVYYPTPLATLQKLSIQLNRPNGLVVSDSLDTLDVSTYIFSNNSSVSGTYYSDLSGYHIWVTTSTWFNQFSMSQSDRIQLKNVVLQQTTAAASDFTQFITRPQGHLIVETGRLVGSSYVTGPNIQGYCNAIVIRSSFVDPTTGAITLNWFGGSQSNHNTFVSALGSAAPTSGRLINLNHQTQVVLRIITRDMDSASRLRPDNAF